MERKSFTSKELEESLIKFQDIKNISSSDVRLMKMKKAQVEQLDVDHHGNITKNPNIKDLKDLLLEELSEHYQTTLSYNCDFSIYIARKYYTIAMVLFSILSLFIKAVTNSFPDNHNVSLIFSFYRLISIGICFYIFMQYKISHQSKSEISNTSEKPDNSDVKIVKDLDNNILNNPFPSDYDEFDKTHTIKVVDLLDKKLVDTSQKYSRWLLLRIISLVISNITAVIALNFLKLEIFGLITLTLPIFVNILSTFLIGEKFHNKYLIACLICIFGGYYALKKPENELLQKDSNHQPNDNLFGIISGLIMVINIAFTNITFKVIGRELDLYNINYFSSTWAAVGTLVLCFIICPVSDLIKIFSPTIMFFGVLAGIFTATSYYLMFYSFSIADISKSSYINYIQLPILAICGILFLSEYLNSNEIIGSLIIMITLIVTTFVIK